MSDKTDLIYDLIKELKDDRRSDKKDLDLWCDKVESDIKDMKDKQEKNSFILTQMEKDIPEIKKDLFEHKEGVIQNRTAIARITERINIQEKKTEENRPVIDSIKDIQEFPEKAKKFIISTSKIMAAIAVILTSVGTIVAYALDWF